MSRVFVNGVVAIAVVKINPERLGAKRYLTTNVVNAIDKLSHRGIALLKRRDGDG